jgi:hypothetical protein
MIPNVEDMQIEYLTRDRLLANNELAPSWVSASDAKFSSVNGAWRELNIGAAMANTQEVVAVRVTLTLSSPDQISIGGVPVRRTTVGVIKLRNREVRP